MIRHHHSTPQVPSRVVVLGASGFVGGDLMNYLREQRIPAVGVSSREIDLTQVESVAQLGHGMGNGYVLVVVVGIDRGGWVLDRVDRVPQRIHGSLDVVGIRCFAALFALRLAVCLGGATAQEHG